MPVIEDSTYYISYGRMRPVVPFSFKPGKAGVRPATHPIREKHRVLQLPDNQRLTEIVSLVCCPLAGNGRPTPDLYDRCRSIEPDEEEGRWVISTSNRTTNWEVIVEPDHESQSVVIITAYPDE